jgi:hypothetical protein
MTATVRGIKADGRSGSIDVDFNREYTVVYLVGTDDRSDGPQVVMSAFGIPNVGDIYTPGNDFDAQAIVIGKAPRQTSPWEWEVDVSYSTQVEEKPEQPASPLEEPPKVSWGFQERRILVHGYYNTSLAPDARTGWDRGIFNSAGELYEPHPEVDIAEVVLNVSRNVASIDWATFFALANCVNFAPWNGADSRTLRLKAPTADSAYDRTIGTYWQVSYGVVYRYDTWDIQILNQGTFYKSGSKKVKFTMPDGTGFVGLLTTGGDALNASSTEHIGTWYSGGADPTYTRMRVYREIDFSSLGIF